jgi:hypothetical protein
MPWFRWIIFETELRCILFEPSIGTGRAKIESIPFFVLTVSQSCTILDLDFYSIELLLGMTSENRM